MRHVCSLPWRGRTRECGEEGRKWEDGKGKKREGSGKVVKVKEGRKYVLR